MRTGFNSVATALVLGYAVLLAACSGPPDIAVTCPSILRAIDTERITRFAEGDGRDITDIVMQAEVRHLTGKCQIDEDEIEMRFPVAIRGVRGPAELDGSENVSIFLHVYTRDRQPLSRQELPFTLTFDGNRTSVVSGDIVNVTIPKSSDQTAKDFILYLGFMLSREELVYNREERRQ